MSNRSFIYRHILIYRFLMNMLYAGGYRKRFVPVIELIKDLPPNASVLELCFGDIYLAAYCKKAGYRWKGIDMNDHFVNFARNSGFESIYEDLGSLKTLPKADVCIMMGSLYHFYPDTLEMLRKMTDASSTIIISEPVINFSNSRGLLGYLAKRAANAGSGDEKFRYDTRSFTTMINDNCKILNCRIASQQQHRKDIIVKIIKQ